MGPSAVLEGLSGEEVLLDVAEGADEAQTVQGAEAVVGVEGGSGLVEGVDDDEAYRRLRKESMRLRITVEDLSGRILDQGRPSEPQPDRRTGHG